MATFTSCTQSGIEVELTPEYSEFYEVSRVLYKLEHPRAGTIKGFFQEGAWGLSPVDGKTFCVNAGSTQYRLGGKRCTRVSLAIPREDYDRALAQAKELEREAREKKAAENRAIELGETPIKLRYHDGEYLSGYGAHGYAAELLERLGLCHDVSGWGVLVHDSVVKALGESFTYPQAVAFSQPARDAKQAKDEAAKKEREEKIAAAKAEANSTGKDVEIDRWTDECDDPQEECSLDIISRVVTPEGNIETRRTHTW